MLYDMQRRVRFAALPKEPLVARFEINGCKRRFLLLKPNEASACTKNPGFPESIRVSGPLPALVAWWRGDVNFHRARQMGLVLDGPKGLVRAFPGWFDLYQFAHVAAAADVSEARV